MLDRSPHQALAGALVLGAVLLLGGCISHGAFQPPRVLDRGESLLGLGISGTTTVDRTGPGDPDNMRVSLTPQLHFRFGLGGRRDVAIRFSGIPPWGVLSADLRYQLVGGSFPVTAGLGVGAYTGCRFWRVEWCESLIREEPGTVLLPSLMFGPDWLYGGGRGIVRFRVEDVVADAEDPDERTRRWVVSEHLWGVIAGTAVGNEIIRFMPEVDVLFSKRDLTMGFGMAMQRLYPPPDGN